MMKANKRKAYDSFLRKKDRVLRIAVDDVLATDIIRFEFCFLKKGIHEFYYEFDIWEDPFEVEAYQDTYNIDLNIPLLWEDLNSGQVFLYGAFGVTYENEKLQKVKSFKYKPGNQELFRLDIIPEYRDIIRQIYSSILTRSG